MRYLFLPLLALTVGCSTTEQYAMVDANVQGEKIIQGVILEDDRHIRSFIGQDPLSFEEVDMCDDLAYQAYNGPLSHRRNLTGSIGTCNRKSGVCAIYWLEDDVCDIIDTAEIAEDRRNRPVRPKKSKLQELQDAVDHCYSGAPKFGPQPPCEMLEDMYFDELEKQR